MTTEVKIRDKKGKVRMLREVHPHAAAIDIGSTSHFVAIPPSLGTNPVREFGCFTPDLIQMCSWLKENGATTVALEATGVYWVPVYQVLEQHGFEVCLVDARRVKNVSGRKSDVLDCQWLQELHSFGLLHKAFVPPQHIGTLRAFWRQRANLVADAARQISLMQKALDLMNLHIHKVLSDISGVSGMRILNAIVNGERDPEALAALCHSSIKSSQATVIKSLTGNYRREHIFALKQALELYATFQQKIADCDAETLSSISQLVGKPEGLSQSKRKRRKNQTHFDLATYATKLSGVDLTAIDGIEAMTAYTLITECGTDMSRFPTEGHFCSWLALCPNNRVTGGKVRSRTTRKAPNRAAKALRLAAQSLNASHSALGAYFRRVKARLGCPKAITATAHKLARIVYRMLKFGEEFVDRGQHAYEEAYKHRTMKSLRKKAASLGFMLMPLPVPE